MSTLPTSVVEALQFEQSIWSNGSVSDDPFYTVPDDAAEAPPGTLLKVEEDVDTSMYTLPPATALSRIIYQSESLNGSQVPVSAYVLWPFSPRSQSDGFPIVAWAHGTSGGTANAAPSHHKNLWQHFLAPYQLALQGYVVVATDYAGLGIKKDASRRPITHEYLACPSHANDVIYSVQAAQTAFPQLSKNFVVVGHSQGGGAAWAVAQRQAIKPVTGYLGAVAISPVTNVFDEPGPFLIILGAAISPGLAAAFPDFRLDFILTPEGENRVNAVIQSDAGVASSVALLSEGEILKPTWKENPYIQKYQSLISNGGKEIGGPLLVIHGERDPRVSAQVTTSAVDKTADLFPSSQLEYVLLPHVTHNPALSASQRLWMDWIGDRFAGREVPFRCLRSNLAPARPGAAYQEELNWYINTATQFFHAP